MWYIFICIHRKVRSESSNLKPIGQIIRKYMWKFFFLCYIFSSRFYHFLHLKQESSLGNGCLWRHIINTVSCGILEVTNIRHHWDWLCTTWGDLVCRSIHLNSPLQCNLEIYWTFKYSNEYLEWHWIYFCLCYS